MFNEELYKALTTIKNLCNETDKCEDCPLYNNGCSVEMNPYAWEFNEEGVSNVKME